MKMLIVSAFCLLAAVGVVPRTATAAEVLLSRDTNIEILREGPVAEELTLGSQLLRKYLLLALGREDLRAKGPKVTFHLEAKALIWNRLDSRELTDLAGIDAFTISTRTQPEPVVTIKGATVLSTCYGIMHFLENRVGITWLFPGDLGLALPQAQEFSIAEAEERVQPAFVSRAYTGLLLPDPDAMLSFREKFQRTELHQDRHFFEAWDYIKALKLHYLTHASHNIVNIYPVRQYAETEPEIYPLKDGERYIPPIRKTTGGHYQAWHPCYTNPRVTEIAIEGAKKCFDRGGHCFSLGINDGLRVQCQCGECLRVGWPESYYQYVTKVAEAVKNRYPPHLIGVLAYGDIRQTREDLKLPDNVLVLVTGARLAKWARHAKHLGTYEYFYGAGFWVPNFPLKGMEWNAQYYRKMGAKIYHAEVHPVWAFDAPKVYIQSRLLWNPDLDVGATLARYCRAAFGEGGEAMTRFYRHWASRQDQEVDPESERAAPMANMGVWRDSSRQFGSVSAAEYALASSCLSEARKRAKGEKNLKRLEMVETFFEYSQTLFKLSSGAQPVFDPDTKVDLRKAVTELSVLIERRKQLLTSMKEHPEWFAGASPTVDELLSTRYAGSGGWTINNEANSGIKTAFFLLGAMGKLTEKDQAELPESLKPYCVPYRDRQIPRYKITGKDQSYYGLHPERFVQMASTGDATGFCCRTGPGNPRIEIERGKGNLKQHWAQATFGRKTHPGRTFFLVELQAAGKKGAFRFSINNLMYGAGWLGVRTPATFGEAQSTVRRKFVVEPLFPDSGYEMMTTAHGLNVLWTPEAEDAALEVTCKVTQIDFRPDKKTPALDELPEVDLLDDDE